MSRVLAGLGFAFAAVKLPTSEGIVSDDEIYMDPKKDAKTLVSLAYYSNGLLQNVILDCCTSMLLQDHFADSKEPYKVDTICSHITWYGQLLCNEYIERDMRT